jgi:hypothetical protein
MSATGHFLPLIIVLLAGIKKELRASEAKLQRIADAIEQTDINDTLMDRLQSLETTKAKLVSDLANAEKGQKTAFSKLPNVMPGLV